MTSTNTVCPVDGTPIEQNATGRRRTFCSDACKLKAHREREWKRQQARDRAAVERRHARQIEQAKNVAMMVITDYLSPDQPGNRRNAGRPVISTTKQVALAGEIVRQFRLHHLLNLD